MSPVGATMDPVSDEPLLPRDAPATRFRQRWDQGWMLLPYGVVAVAAAIALLDPATGWTDRAVWAGACARLIVL